MDLVDEEGNVARLAKVGDGKQLSPRPHASGWIVRAAQQVGRHLVVRERLVERLEVEVVAAGGVAGKRSLHDVAPGELDPEEERRVDRRVDDDPGSG